MALDFYNSNGLEDGRIPAGKECPFLAECRIRNDNCPSEARGNVRHEHAFSCGGARAISIAKESQKMADGQPGINSTAWEKSPRSLALLAWWACLGIATSSSG